MKHSIYRILCVLVLAVAAVAAAPDAARADVDITYQPGWTVIDNGPAGLPGANQYAWRCNASKWTLITYLNGSKAHHSQNQSMGRNASSSCYSGVFNVPADPGNVMTRAQIVRVSGVSCTSADFVNTDGTAYAAASWVSSVPCWVSNPRTIRHTWGYWAGDFCSGSDCVWGWMANTVDYAVAD